MVENNSFACVVIVAAAAEHPPMVGSNGNGAGDTYPWTYDNDLFGGPDFWGLMHKHWRMCKAGKLQSPINIDPEKLVFDPGLGKLAMSSQQLDAQLWNTGQFPLLVASPNGSNGNLNNNNGVVHIRGGPAHPYRYQFNRMLFHYGDVRRGERGSEHTLDRQRFPAEVQLMAFNSDLYENFTEAQSQPRGLLAIALIVDIGEHTNPELKRLTQAAPAIRHRNQMASVRHFQPAALLPATEQFVSYEGSLTFPGCFETVTWIIYNSPIYITAEHLTVWAGLVQSEQPPKEEQQNSREQPAPPPPAVPLTSNYRPLKANNGRLVRTNINVKLKSSSPSATAFSAVNDGHCPSNVYVDMGYQSNRKRWPRGGGGEGGKEQQKEEEVEEEVGKHFHHHQHRQKPKKQHQHHYMELEVIEEEDVQKKQKNNKRRMTTTTTTTVAAENAVE